MAFTLCGRYSFNAHYMSYKNKLLIKYFPFSCEFRNSSIPVLCFLHHLVSIITPFRRYMPLEPVLNEVTCSNCVTTLNLVAVILQFFRVCQVYASVPLGEVAIYSVANTTYFRVDRLTGIIYVTTPLENVASYTFTVVASFQSAPQNMSLAYVHVEILPGDSLTLHFPQRWYTISVLANISKGGYVTTMRANASSMQNLVRYSIQGPETIGINPVTGR